MLLNAPKPGVSHAAPPNPAPRRGGTRLRLGGTRRGRELATQPVWRRPGAAFRARALRVSDAAPPAHPAHRTRLTPEDEALLRRLLQTPLPELMREAAALRDSAHPSLVTFSPKVFIPLTRLCRDRCAYCTFATPPAPGRRAYMALDEVVAVARLGAQAGCTEALFTLGDRPEAAYPQAASELREMGFETTLQYVAAAARAVLAETGLLPHVNAGAMSAADCAALREVSASQGLMLEGTAAALTAPGGPHWGCPDKEPGVRVAAIAAAGEARVPFTSGVLVGIGESRWERLEALLELRRLHDRYGHLQETIVQNFRAKRGTPMEDHPEPPLEELLWTVAAARILLGPTMSIQAPPNLTPAEGGDASELAPGWRALIDAGINDFGGISPVTRDYVNPERPWPHLAPLAAAVASAGKLLVPRLPIYPAFALDLTGRWMSDVGGADSVGAAVRRAMDSSGLVRGSEWCPGLPEEGAHQQVGAFGAAAPDGGSGDRGDATGAAEEAGRWGGERPAGSGSLHELASSSSGSNSRDDRGGGDTPAATSGRRRRSHVAPPPSRRLWRVAMSPLGTLDDLPQPAAASPRLRELLAAILSSAPAPGEAPRTLGGAAAAAADAAAGGEEGAGGGGGREVYEPSAADLELLLAARGADMQAVVAAADELRRRVVGDEVSFVVNRNINYTNGSADAGLRGPSYLLPLEEVSRRAAEAWDRGATEVCMQGGIHPSFTGETYLSLLAAAKAGAPDIHVHAFSPLEVAQGAHTLGLPVPDFLAMLRDAGLGSLPGTSAEVLDDDVRRVLCPDKLTSDEWLEVVEAAHSVGLPTTSTLMFGSVESPAAWAQHLLLLRRLQARSGGLTEFVPLPFVHMQSPIFLKGNARRGPTLRECVLLHAVARLALHPHVAHIQASWVKMGPHHAAALLGAGCDDMGGSLMNESITRAAGATHGQELTPHRMQELIRREGRTPRQRTTLYGAPPRGQREKLIGVADKARRAGVEGVAAH